MPLIQQRSLYNKFLKTTTLDVFFYFVIYMYLSFFSPYLDTLGWSEGMKGIFFSVFSMTGIFMATIAGTLSDKIGRFKLIIIGMCLEVVALVGYAYVQNTVALLFLRVLSAIAFNLVVVSAMARINDVVNNKNRSVANGLFHSIISVAAMTAPLIGGFVADFYGFKILFLIAMSSMSALIGGFLIFDYFFFNPKKHFYRDHKGLLKARDFNPFKNIKDFLSYPRLRSIAVLGFMANLTVPLTGLVFPFIIIQRMGLSNSHLSIVIFTMGLAYIMQYFLGHLTNRMGKGRGIIIGLSISSLGIFTLFFVNTFEVFLLVVFIKSLGSALWNISAWSYMSDIGEDNKMEGKVVGSYVSLARIAITISFVASGFLLDFFSTHILIVYAIAMVLPLFFVGKIFLKKTKQELSWEH